MQKPKHPLLLLGASLFVAILVMAGLLYVREQKPDFGPLIDYNPEIARLKAKTTKVVVIDRSVHIVRGNRIIGMKEDVSRLEGAREIERLFATLDLVPVPKNMRMSCMCGGNPELVFYDGDTTITQMTVHHGQSIRWNEKCHSDVDLTKQAAERSLRMFAGLGVPAYIDQLKRKEEFASAGLREDSP